jgi:ABC-type nitrate/sulfonate/bicarbonate transport system substrate-binding protein
MLALDALRAQGYEVQATHFASPDLAAAALADGKVDIGSGSNAAYWSAIAKGARMVTIMEQTRNLWSLVTGTDLKECRDLQGKRIGVNATGVSRALFEGYLKENCPDTKPETLFIAGSDNRAAALQKGAIEGSMLELSDLMDVEDRAPGRFHGMIQFGEANPKLKTTGVHASRPFAEQHPDSVRAYIRAVLTVHRQIAKDPAVLSAALVKHLQFDNKHAQEIAEAYLKQHLWDVNGGLTRDDIDYSLNFFINGGSVPQGLTAAAVADTSFLDSTLQEMTRLP